MDYFLDEGKEKVGLHPSILFVDMKVLWDIFNASHDAELVEYMSDEIMVDENTLLNDEKCQGNVSRFVTKLRAIDSPDSLQERYS